jgi:hypothetical protein
LRASASHHGGSRSRSRLSARGEEASEAEQIGCDARRGGGGAGAGEGRVEARIGEEEGSLAALRLVLLSVGFLAWLAAVVGVGDVLAAGAAEERDVLGGGSIAEGTVVCHSFLRAASWDLEIDFGLGGLVGRAGCHGFA